MKTLQRTIFILFVISSLGFSTNKKSLTDPIKVLATFQGYYNDSYSFLFVNEEGDEEEISFENVSEKILSTYNLKDNNFIGQEFEITYNYEVSEEEETEFPVLISIKKIE